MTSEVTCDPATPQLSVDLEISWTRCWSGGAERFGAGVLRRCRQLLKESKEVKVENKKQDYKRDQAESHSLPGTNQAGKAPGSVAERDQGKSSDSHSQPHDSNQGAKVPGSSGERNQRKSPDDRSRPRANY